MSLETRRRWDYVVVGAGSSGAVVAEHLSADGAAQVLLLEAGADRRPSQTPPEMRRGHWTEILDLARFPQYQWAALTARRTPDRPPAHYWRGRGMGGSSSINGQVAIRPPLDEFAMWDATEPDRWCEAAVLDRFVALEDDLMFPDAPYHGSGGPIPISRATVDTWGPLDIAFKDALERRGHPWEPDANRPGATGVSIYPYNAHHGDRVSTNEAFIEPARARPNFTVAGDCLVDRVLLRGGRAVGVRALRGGQPVEIEAGVVVLSAGAIHSPAILLRSGVGPAEDLRALGLTVEADLPVGRRLQEHPAVAFAFAVPQDLPPSENGRHTNVLVRWTSGLDGTGAHDMMGMTNGPSPDAPGVAAIGLWVNQACSYGRLRLVSTDPTVDPEVDLDLAADPRDRQRLVDCLPIALEILDDPAFRGLRVGPIVGPDGSEIPSPNDAAAVERWVMATVDVAAHVCATCTIGHPDDGGVVDSRGRVHGIDALWVVDMSIAPASPRANTNLTAIMLAGLLAPGIGGRALPPGRPA